MKSPKKKKSKAKEPSEEPSRHSRGIEALAPFTSSEVVQQLKIGMSRIAPIEMDKDNSEDPDY
jgi:hypothetical protein